MKGFYHVQMARERLQLGDIEGAKDHYLKGGNFYIEAANKLPDDDEEHACMLIIQSSRLFMNSSLPQGTSTAVSTTFSNVAANQSEKYCQS